MKKIRLGSDPLTFIKDTSDDGEEIKVNEEKSSSDVVSKGKNMISVNIEESSLGIGTITFDGEMTICNSKKIRNALCSGVNDYNQFNVELSRVKKIDTSGFQLLLSTLKEIKQKNKVMNFIKPSKEIKKFFNLFGEEQLLKEMIK